MCGYYIDIMIPEGWISRDGGVTIIKKTKKKQYSPVYEIPHGYERVSEKNLGRINSYTTVAKQIRLTDAEITEYQNCLGKEETNPMDDRCNELLEKLLQSYGGKRKSRKTSKSRKSRKPRKSNKNKSRKGKSRKSTSRKK